MLSTGSGGKYAKYNENTDKIQMGLVGKYILIQMHDALLSNDITD